MRSPAPWRTRRPAKPVNRLRLDWRRVTMAALAQVIHSMESMQRLARNTERLNEAVNNSSIVRTAETLQHIDHAFQTNTAAAAAAEALQRVDRVFNTHAARAAEALQRIDRAFQINTAAAAAAEALQRVDRVFNTHAARAAEALQRIDRAFQTNTAAAAAAEALQRVDRFMAERRAIPQHHLDDPFLETDRSSVESHPNREIGFLAAYRRRHRY